MYIIPGYINSIYNIHPMLTMYIINTVYKLLHLKSNFDLLCYVVLSFK